MNSLTIGYYQTDIQNGVLGMARASSLSRSGKALLRQAKNRTFDLASWSRSGYASPAPQYVKWDVLRRYGSGATYWIETGTNAGRTTSMLAEKLCPRVVTIEPSVELAELARQVLRTYPGVTLLVGTSEQMFANALNQVSGVVAFWLDGHYSGGNTYLGEDESSIVTELKLIQEDLPRLTGVRVFVDDFRCFPVSTRERAGYPPRGALIEFAESNGLWWTVEHDIFIAVTPEDVNEDRTVTQLMVSK